MIKYRTEKIIDVYDWDNLIIETYGRPYSFQQQNGCQERQMFSISIPSEDIEDDKMNDSIPEVVNGNIRGIKFSVWLSRDPEQPLPNREDNYSLGLFWERSFYPDIYTVANDLYEKGLIEAGDYLINIDW